MPHHREGTEPSHQERVLRGVRSSHTDAVLQPVVGKGARAVQDENHPSRQAREQTRSMRSTIGGYAAAHPPSLLYENPAPVAHGVMTTPFYAAVVSHSLRSALLVRRSRRATPIVSYCYHGHVDRQGSISDGVGRFPCPEAPYRTDKLDGSGELVHYLIGARFGGPLEARG